MRRLLRRSLARCLPTFKPCKAGSYVGYKEGGNGVWRVGYMQEYKLSEMDNVAVKG